MSLGREAGKSLVSGFSGVIGPETRLQGDEAVGRAPADHILKPVSRQRRAEKWDIGYRGKGGLV